MKTVLYYEHGGPEVLTLGDTDRPAIKDDEVLVEVKASGINPVDTYFRSGKRPVKEFPAIPHFDVAGIIRETGQNVHEFQVGDRVWGTNIAGTAREFVNASSGSLFPLPNTFSFEEGATLGIPAITAHLSLFNRAKLEPGETVLIYGGAGAVGHAAIQLASQHGATVIATASSAEKEEICLQAGAEHVIRLDQESNPEQAVLSSTNQEGVDVILDMSFSENVEQNLTIGALGVRIVTIGSPKNNQPQIPWGLLNQKHGSLLGVLVFTAPETALHKAGMEITQAIQNGTFKAHVGGVYEPGQAKQAHKDLENKKYAGSLVLKFT
ncbi:NADPH:quinone reductase [Salsuginibacillus kocurii]|uniref:NADPH:quinone reductase n=1 Tax=Salsuginibacillus kocurii TaxID=427078 RepID=UPI00037A01E6|nr:NADPH:quinone reductase [Salsuginibacillus kocurii]